MCQRFLSALCVLAFVASALAQDPSDRFYQALRNDDLSTRGCMNTTVLLAATYANDTAIVKLLIQKNVDVNARDVTGDTALMNAASYGNVELTRMLLAKGADVNAASVAEVSK